MLGLIRLMLPCYYPQPFRVGVLGRIAAQPVRRCLTHLLPGRPTFVGGPDLTSHNTPTADAGIGIGFALGIGQELLTADSKAALHE